MLTAPLAGAQQIGVMVNDQPVRFRGIGPQQVQGRVLVPVRGVLEKLGADVEWQPQTQTVVAGNGQIDITLKIGDRRAIVNTREVDLDVPAQVIDGYTFVPLRFLGEALGADVRWDARDQTVIIHTANGPNGNRGDREDRRDHSREEHRGGPAPVVNSFVQDSRRWLRGGDTIHAVLDGTQGGQAAFRIPGLVDEVPMREVSPGHYVGEWQAPTGQPIQLPQSAVIGSLRVGDRSSQLIQAARPVAIDTIPPQLRDRAPSPDSHVNNPRPSIYAVFTDEGSGIDPASVRLIVDGRDVTPNATVSPEFISFTPSSPLPPGRATVHLVAADRAGNRTEADWQFMEDQHEERGIRGFRNNANRMLRPGDILHVEMDGSQGGKCEFSLGNVKHVPCAEKSPGHYVADYTVRRGDDVNNARLVAALTTPDGARFERQSDNTVTVDTGKPGTPVIAFPRPNDTPGSPLTIKGKTWPNGRIHVTVVYRSKVLNLLAVNGTALDAVVQADRNGNWETPPVALNGLLTSHDVEYTVTAVAINSANQQSDPATSRFHLR